MDGIRLEVDLDGILPSARLAKLAAGAEDTLQLMSDVGAELESSQLERIDDTKVAPDGTPWAPNRAGTSILKQTGRHLRDSSGFIADANSVQVGFSWEYAHVHQDGAVIKPKDGGRLSFMIGNQRVFAKQVVIPARPIVGMSAEDEGKIERVALEWLSGLMSGLPGAPL